MVPIDGSAYPIELEAATPLLLLDEIERITGQRLHWDRELGRFHDGSDSVFGRIPSFLRAVWNDVFR